MKIITRAGMLTAAIAAGLFATSVQTRAASVNLSVTLPKVTILDYYSSINVNIDSASLLTALNTKNENSLNAAPAGTLSASTGSLNLALGALSASATGSLSALTLNINNAWAVRSLQSSSGANTTVSAVLATATLSNGTSATDKITMTALEPTSGSTTGSGGNISVTGTGLAPSKAVVGGYTMTMDLSNATSAATYTGGVITVTATSS